MENGPDATCKFCNKGIDYIAGEFWKDMKGNEDCPDSPDGTHHDSKEEHAKR